MRRITLSMGVAAFPDHGNNPADLIQSVINALKLAKKTGRDRIVVGEE
jgi:GGDEF domain-containing protein